MWYNDNRNFRNGKSDITSMKLSTAIEFEKLYEKLGGKSSGRKH